MRTGLGPQGGMHSPQELHSDHEPFPAMSQNERSQWGGERQRETERWQGHGVQGEVRNPPRCTSCPIPTVGSAGGGGHSQPQRWML